MCGLCEGLNTWYYNDKMCDKDSKRVSNIKYNQLKLNILFFFTIWNHSNYGKLVFFFLHTNVKALKIKTHLIQF
jgi:hypothetical protein